MTMPDARWKQRFKNYRTALGQLQGAVELAQSRQLSDLERQGVIQAFEFTHELAWNVLKDYFQYQGNPGITGSRDAAREAFQKGLVQDGAGWMEMIRSRNMTTHTYNRVVADEIVGKILGLYYGLFVALRDKMDALDAG